MMCPDHELISAWLDGEVPSPWSEGVQKHIASCPACADYADSIRRITSLCEEDAGSCSAEALEAAKARVSERISFSAARLEGRRASLWTKRFSIPAPVVAAAALVVAVLGLALLQSGRQNYDLRLAASQTFQIAPVASGSNIQTVIDLLSKQNAPVNINITLPAESFGGSIGEPLIIREADFRSEKQ